MFDVTFLIPDTDWDECDCTLPDPDSEIPDLEKDRLFEELCALIDAGAYDPDNETLV